MPCLISVNSKGVLPNSLLKLQIGLESSKVLSCKNMWNLTDWILKLQIKDCHQNLLPLWSIGLVVIMLDSQSRAPRLKITGWLSLSSFRGQLNEHQDLLGTFFNSCLAALQPTLGHSQVDSLINAMLITAFGQFDPNVTRSLVMRFRT